MVSIFRSIFKIFVVYAKFHSRFGLNNFIKKNIPRDGVTINVGSNGSSAILINELSNMVVNVDIDIEREPDVIANVEMLPFSNVDCITCIDVLEHVMSPQAAIDSIYRSLRVGGVAVISIPFIFGLHDEPHDYQRLTKYQIIRYARNFESISIENSNYFFVCIYVLIIRLINYKKIYVKIIGILFMILTLPLVPIVYLLDKLTKIDCIATRYHIKLIK